MLEGVTYGDPTLQNYFDTGDCTMMDETSSYYGGMQDPFSFGGPQTPETMSFMSGQPSAPAHDGGMC